MKEQKYVPLGGEHCEKIGKTVFVVNSFADSTADKSSEELIIQLAQNNGTSWKSKMADDIDHFIISKM